MRSLADDLHSKPGTGRAPPKGARRVLVWDRAVRAFHWLLVGGIVVAWVSGGSGHRVHEITGSAVAALVAFRLLWGMIGSRHARFADFVTGPLTVLRYVAAHVKSHPQRHLGHNPAGGYMILALLATIAMICVTGAMQLTNAFFGVDWVETLHHAAANCIWVLVGLHIVGALTASRMHKENLVAAMVSGWKPLHVEGEPPTPLAVRQRRRLKFDHLQVRAVSRNGAALLGSFVACGAAAGLYATSGRVHRDMTEATVMAATPAPVAVPAAATAKSAALKPEPKREVAAPVKTTRAAAKAQQKSAAKAQDRTALKAAGKSTKTAKAEPAKPEKPERGKKSKAGAVADGGGNAGKSGLPSAAQAANGTPQRPPFGSGAALPAPYGLGMSPSALAP